jgi:phytol kinase
MTPLFGMALVLLTLGGLLGGLTLYRRLGAPHPELLRKLLHVGMGLTTLAFPFLFDEAWPVLVLGALSVLLLLLTRFISGLKANVGQVVGGVSRFSLGEIYFPIAVAILWLLYLYGEPAGASEDSSPSHPRHLLLYLVPLLLLAISDALAALVGVSYGGHKYATSEGTKSHEGSIAFFLSAFLCVHIPLLLIGDRGRPETLLIALLLALVATMFEAIAWAGLDNLVLPLVSHLLLLLYWDLSVHALVMRLVVTAGLFVVAIIVSRWTALRGSAILGAVLVGYICWALGDWPWLVPPAVLFAGYVLLSCRNATNKDTTHNVHGVICVASAGLAWLFLSKIVDRPQWIYPFTVAFAAHLGMIALAQLRFQWPAMAVLAAVAAAVAFGWFALLAPYVAIEKGTAQAFAAAALALPPVALAVAAFALLQPYLTACPLDTPRWLRQGFCAAAASVLAVGLESRL